MSLRICKLLGATGAVLSLFAAVAVAAGPPPPTTPGGTAAQLVASGLMTPTAFAFGDGAVFEGDGGSSSSSGPPNGGVFLLKNGAGTLIPGSPQFVGGLAWRAGTLYVSGGFVTGANSAKWQLLAWSGWNGTTFTKQKAIYTAPNKFQGFNGLAFGADGRLYVGADTGLTNNNDHGPASTSPYLYDILSIQPNGKGLQVFAKGIRQPWQLAFPKGSNSPFASDLGQDHDAVNPPDFLLRVHQGDNYGFPRCNWTKATACRGFAKPFKLFSPHTDVGGLAIIGSQLYISEFGFTPAHPPAVVSMPLSGGSVKTVLKGFAAPVIGLAANAGWLYVGDLAGQVYRIKP